MLGIIRKDLNGEIDKTLSTDYNENSYTIDQLQAICRAWAEEDNDGTEYYLQTMSEYYREA